MLSNEAGLPDEGQRQDVVRVDGNEPITILGVRVGMWVVRRQDKSIGASKVSSTRSYDGNKSKVYNYSKKVLKCHKM